jgi:hypothetical protein
MKRHQQPRQPRTHRVYSAMLVALLTLGTAVATQVITAPPAQATIGPQSISTWIVTLSSGPR